LYGLLSLAVALIANLVADFHLVHFTIGAFSQQRTHCLRWFLGLLALLFRLCYPLLLLFGQFDVVHLADNLSDRFVGISALAFVGVLNFDAEGVYFFACVALPFVFF